MRLIEFQEKKTAYVPPSKRGKSNAGALQPKADGSNKSCSESQLSEKDKKIRAVKKVFFFL